MSIGLDEASLLALIIESTLFGLFTALFCTTNHILLFRRNGTDTLNKPVIFVSALMYTVAFSHILVCARRAVIAFITVSGRNESPNAYFSVSDDALYLGKVGLYVFQTLTGDSFIIYRLYVVWGRDKRLLIPALTCLLGSLVCGIMALIDAALVSPTTIIFIPELKHWIVSFFSLTLFTNFSCTALIAFKLWWTKHQLQQSSHYLSLSPVMAIVIESGVVYSASLISLLAAYVSGSWGHYIILDMTTQLIGIVFSLIIVRIALGISATNPTQRIRARSQPPNVAVNRSHDQAMHMQPLVVRFTRNRSVKDDRGVPPSVASAGTDASDRTEVECSAVKPVGHAPFGF